jgi:hypothetical protein
MAVRALRAKQRDRLDWLRLGVLAGFACVVVVWLARPYVYGDTPFVLDGTNAFLDCLSDRDLVACRYSGELDPYEGLTSPIGDWPLLQHVPDALALVLGANGHHARELVLVVLGVAGIVGSVALAGVALRAAGRAEWFWGFLFVLLSGPLIAYAGTTAGEALAASLLVSLVAAAVLPAPPVLLALAALAACFTKETSYPFVIALGVLGLLLARRRTGRAIRGHLIWGALGVTLAFVLASLFNVVRFGGVLNKNYMETPLHTPTFGRVLDYVIALFASPSGGMVLVWPAASVVLLFACLVPLTRGGRHLDLLPALVLIGVISGVTLSFASWWSPFGWTAYGPRLTLPWVLPLVLLALVAYGEPVGDLARRVLTPVWGLLAVFALVFVLALPHVGQMWQQDAKAAFFEQSSPPCSPPWRVGVARFHRCQHTEIWSSLPMGVYTVRGVTTLGGAVLSVVSGATLLGCLVLLRSGLDPGRRHEAARRDAGRERR